MPPKPKFTREEIIDGAMQTVRKYGFNSLTARSLANAVNSSPRPIFTLFESMDEVQQEVIFKARKLYEEYQDKGLSEENPFKGSGMSYIKFAMDEPKLFQLLFMRDGDIALNMDNALINLDNYHDKILSSVQNFYGFPKQIAEELYRHLWIYSHGIATLIATGVCELSSAEVEKMLGEVGKSLVIEYKKSEKSHA